jgi:hypothetical protein
MPASVLFFAFFFPHFILFAASISIEFASNEAGTLASSVAWLGDL